MCPILSLFFWNSFFFPPCEEFLVFFLSVPFFSRDFRGSVGIKNPCFFWGGVVFPAFFQKKTRKGRTGYMPLGTLGLRTRWPCTGVKIPKESEKEGFWVSDEEKQLLQNPLNFSEVAPEVRSAVHTAALRLRVEKPPFLAHPEKGCSSQPIAFFPVVTCRKRGDCLTQIALFQWGFFDPETLFSRFWRVWPLYRAGAFATLGLHFISLCSGKYFSQLLHLGLHPKLGRNIFVICRIDISFPASEALLLANDLRNHYIRKFWRNCFREDFMCITPKI